MILSGSQEKRSIRNQYGQYLAYLGEINKNIVVLDADLSCSTQTCQFAKKYPERFFNIGIAEQDLITTAVGLSLTGKIPFVSSFAMFLTGRAWEQIRNSVCYQNANVKLISTHAGITVGEDGASHQALEDISIMRSIPNMMVIIPADCCELKFALDFALEYNGPIYIRIPRSNVYDIFDDLSYKFKPYSGVKIKEGKDVSIFSNGETLKSIIDCAKILKDNGIEAEIIHLPFVKPIDQEIIIDSVKKTQYAVTVENHSIIGGLGSAVAEVTSEYYPVRVLRIGMKDQFGQSAEQSKLLDYYGLTAKKIAYKIMESLKK